ncbi:hypothetical protein BGX21_005617 [Mortierella sp. AD011]|nr:hypothetical protein BGX20_002628 [Mortierella sp. AD010]KAF9399792.1 hypothetical protein BGX21_005617 [Mortierella sp. AD011]
MSTAPKYAAKSTLRSIKNFSKGYTDMQAKVREATSNDPWGPSGTQMNVLANATYNQQEFLEIMEILDKRMNDKGKNWRHVFKALTVLDYLLHVGSENVVKYARENLYIVKTLKEFQYIDEDGKDQGSNVRQKAKDITALLSDESRLKEERQSRNAMRDRMNGRAPGEATTPTYDRPGFGDDDRDLQRALEESRRMAQNENHSRNSEDDDLQRALELSKKEEQDRLKTVEKYNELSLTEDWEADNKPKNLYEQQSNVDFFGNDFGHNNNNFNNNNFDAFSSTNEFGNVNGQNFLQQQQTGMNNPYLQFQQQHLQQQQLQQQQLLQQQMLQQQMQQQQQQQQQMAFMNSMNPYQQLVVPQPTGAPNVGSNNPFSAFAQKPAMTGQPLNTNGTNGFGSFNFDNNNNNNNNNINNNNKNPLGELAFLQNSMATGSPTISQPTPKTPNAHDEKYASLASALANREDGMDTFGNTGQLRIPAHHSFGLGRSATSANPFQNKTGSNNNTLIDIGDSTTTLGRSNTTNPFQANSGFLSSQATGFGNNNTGFNQFSTSTNGGAFRSNTLF